MSNTKNAKNVLINALGIIYLSVLIYLLFFAFFRKNTTTQVNLVPFKTIITFFTDFYLPHWWYWVINIPGNIVAFIPIPLIINNLTGCYFRSSTKFIVALFIPTGIELLQWVFQVGSPNIDDVILNSIGFYFGYSLLSRYKKRGHENK